MPVVEFFISQKQVEGDGRFESILELAKENRVPIESDCQQGICGTCKTRLLSGKVEMQNEDGLNDEDLENNMILPCVAVPLTDIKLEA